MKEGVSLCSCGKIGRDTLPLGIYVALVARHVVRKLSVSRPIRKGERRIERLGKRGIGRERKINGG